MAVGTFETFKHRCARQKEGLQHPFFNQRHRLRSDAFNVVQIMAEQGMAAELGLRGIVHHVHPIRKNARAYAILQVARACGAALVPDRHRLARHLEIVAQNLAEQLRRGLRLKQTGPS